MKALIIKTERRHDCFSESFSLYRSCDHHLGLMAVGTQVKPLPEIFPAATSFQVNFFNCNIRAMIENHIANVPP